jgi:hypothetical protein
MLQDTHHLNTVFGDAVIDLSVHRTRSAVAWSNMVDHQIKARLLGQDRESLLELLAVSVRLRNPEPLVTVSHDGNQIIGALS